jgi:K+-sensing histidine kinase KdpD
MGRGRTPCRSRTRPAKGRSPRLAEKIIAKGKLDGRGIPIGSCERIFEKFRRGEGEPSRVGNFGLGLYICRRAIEAHGGTIGVVEREGWATSFDIVLPR